MLRSDAKYSGLTTDVLDHAYRLLASDGASELATLNKWVQVPRYHRSQWRFVLLNPATLVETFDRSRKASSLARLAISQS